MASGLLVYDDSIDTSEIHQVLFIDSNVSVFKDYVNTDTFHITYDRNCTRAQMLEVLSSKFSTISRIAVVSHFSETPYFLTGGDVFGLYSLRSDGASRRNMSGDAPISELLFSEANTQFIIDVIKKFQVSNVDYLACNTLSSSVWTDYYSTISSSTGATIGASDNNTGNIKYGGDWILESTHEDIQSVYFNDLLQNYASLLLQYYDNDYYYNYTIGTNTASLYRALSWRSIPSSLYINSVTYSVTSIESQTFSLVASNSQFRYIIIPSSITTIGDSAFQSSLYLQDVTFPTSGLTTISNSAFWNCFNMVNVTFPNSLKSIGAMAFGLCKTMTSISIPSSVTYIGIGSFYECSAMTSISVIATNSNYSSLNGVLFNYNKSTLMQYPAGLTSISYTIPTSVKIIDQHAFRGCIFMTSISIPSSVTSISAYAFMETALTTINIPDSVTYINNASFYQCKALTSITIPRSVTYIDESSFYGCSALTSISVDVANQNYSTSNGVLFNYNKSTLILYPIGSTELSYTIPSSVTRINNLSFAGCSNLVSIVIPSSVISIGYGAFYSCSNLKKVYFMGPAIPSIDSNNFTTTADTAYYISGATNTAILTPIFSYTFIGIYSNNGIVYGYNSAGASIISWVSTLSASVTIPSTITTGGTTYNVTSIYVYAFYNCTSMTSVVIPSSVTSIGNYSFFGCSTLTKVYFMGPTIPSIGTNNFNVTGDTAYYYYGATNTEILTNSPAMFSYTSIIYLWQGIIYSNSGSIAFAFSYDSTLPAYVTIPSTIIFGSTRYNVTSIGDNAFSNCTSIISIVIPSSITSIGQSAFQGCTNLSSVIFSTNNVLNSIGIRAFSGCNALNAINFTNITTPTPGWSIGNYAFDCSNLLCVVFGTSLPAINSSVPNPTFTANGNIAYKPSSITLTANLLSNFANTSVSIVDNSISPTSVTATSTSYGSASVTFTPGNSPQPPITNYKYSIDDGNTWTLCCPAILTEDTITRTSFTISGLSSGTTYSVRILSTNFIRDSPASTAYTISVFTTTRSTIGPFSTIGTNNILGINNISNLSVNTNCLAFHAPMGIYFTNPNLYAPTTQYFNFNSNKGFTFNSGTTRLATIDNVGSLSCNGLSVVGGVGGGGNITCESNIFVLGKVLCPQLQLSNSSTIVSIRCINFNVGTNSSGLKTGNIVPYGNTYADSTKLFFTITFNNNNNGNVQINNSFSTTIVSVTSTSMTFNLQRTDMNDPWTNNLIAQIIITEIA